MKRHIGVQALILAAEESQRCIVTRDKAERMALARRVQAGDMRRVLPGMYVRSSVWESLSAPDRTLHMARAWSVNHTVLGFAGITAATAYGFDHQWLLHDGGLTIATHLRGGCHTFGPIRYIYVPQSHMNKEMVAGVVVTTPARTIFDCAQSMDFRLALPIAISAVRKGVRFEDVMDVCVRMRRGSRRICTLMRYANAATENGGEAFALGTMLEEGIPMPRLQQGFTDPQTGRQYWADFVWRLDNGRVVVGEYDGMRKYVDTDMASGKSIRGVVNDERIRESAIIRAGASDVVRFGFADVLNRAPLLAKLFEKGVPRSGVRVSQIW